MYRYNSRSTSAGGSESSERSARMERRLSSRGLSTRGISGARTVPVQSSNPDPLLLATSFKGQANEAFVSRNRQTMVTLRSGATRLMVDGIWHAPGFEALTHYGVAFWILTWRHAAPTHS